jgi:2-oxoglutarate dehydrogenase complex dehydrogenase (E1) component-like enzyme
MLFDEFEGKKKQDLTSGDVKYHMGYLLRRHRRRAARAT